MKNSSSLKPKIETPKTPGGISKSLLTPCRRVGLSRNWRKSVASPFNSPLASTEVKQDDDVETRKRKEVSEETLHKAESDCNGFEIGTPTRKVELPRRKKSKTLLNSIKTSENSAPETQQSSKQEITKENDEVSTVVTTPVCIASKSKINEIKVSINKTEDTITEVSTPVRLKSKSINKKITPVSINSKVMDTNTNHNISIKTDEVDKVKQTKTKHVEMTNKKENEKSDNTDKKKSPNNLTKECIVVIQKKIFKNQLKANELSAQDNSKKQNTPSQALFNDSDSDDIPLHCLNKTKTKADVGAVTIDDNDFAVSKPQLKKTSSNTSQKEKTNLKTKSTAKPISKDSLKAFTDHNIPSQSSIDDDDFCEKKTILVRKTYEKVIKPSKAKSTGSITQKDIDDLKARIETKKKMLLAKSMTDTKDLRDLIKKWQKGCQDALIELMDLMKNKCPEQGMEYSQILQTLQIPATLVGYDSDNDCFVTPEDENIILSHIKE